MVTQAEIRLVAASFPKTEDAQAAVAELKRQGFEDQDISVVYTDSGHVIRTGLLAGAVWGGVLGALFGMLFPPLGLIIAAGPIAGVLASGAVVGATGALTVGALDALVAGLIHLGMPQEMATRFGEHVHKGDTLVTAHAPSAELAQKARQILEVHHPRSDVSPDSAGVVSVR